MTRLHLRMVPSSFANGPPSFAGDLPSCEPERDRLSRVHRGATHDGGFLAGASRCDHRAAVREGGWQPMIAVLGLVIGVVLGLLVAPAVPLWAPAEFLLPQR